MESHLTPFTAIKIVGVILMITLVSPANVAGIGGGVFFVPLLISIYKYDAHTAMHMSSILVFSASLLKVYFAATSKHPKRDRPSIDFNLLLILMPALMVAVKFGVIAHSKLPEFYLLIALSAILFIVSYLTLTKGISLYKAESKSKILLSDKKSQEEVQEAEQLSQGALKIIEEEKIMLPKGKIALLVFTFVTLVVIDLLIEGISSVSMAGIKRCSSTYWILFGIYIIINFVILIQGFYRFSAETTQRKLFNVVVYPQDDINVSKGVQTGVVGSIAGLLAGMFGIGGGVFVNPLLLQMGHFPEVVASTSIILILISTAASSFQYIMISNFSLWETNFFNIFTLAGTLFANLYITDKIKKTGRSSIIVFVTMLVLFLSAGFSLYIAIYKRQYDYDAVMHMHSFCNI